jgi:hypothetical protein
VRVVGGERRESTQQGGRPAGDAHVESLWGKVVKLVYVVQAQLYRISAGRSSHLR